MIVEAKQRKPDVVATMSWQDAVNLRSELMAVSRLLYKQSLIGMAPDCPQLEVLLAMLRVTLGKEGS